MQCPVDRLHSLQGLLQNQAGRLALHSCTQFSCHIRLLLSAGTQARAMLLSTIAFHKLHTTICCFLHADMHKASAKMFKIVDSEPCY